MRDPVVIVGASGFGRESLDAVQAMIRVGGQLELLGVVDDSPSETNLARLSARGVAYLGTIDTWLGSNPSADFVLAIGSPKIRRKLATRLECFGLRALTVIHPTAILGSETEFAEGLVVCAGAIISTNVRLGKHVHVNPGVIVGHDSVADEYVSINPGAVISGEVSLQADVLVGAAATVLQQLSIGNGSLVGAGALVTRNVPSGVIVKGVPGRWQPDRDPGGAKR